MLREIYFLYSGAERLFISFYLEIELIISNLIYKMMESEKKPSSAAISNFGAWAMNIVSSVGIIMANKQLMSNNGYAFTFGQLINSLISTSIVSFLFFMFGSEY